MNEREVAALLGWSRETVLDSIQKGIELPKSEKVVKLVSDSVDGGIDISDKHLDQFIGAFEAKEPGRHPPVAVRRQLRTEARHKCAICGADLPLQFHHIIEWHELKHHDARHMLAVCGGCHDKITVGQIDKKEQRIYKQSTQDALERQSVASKEKSLFNAHASSPLSWDYLRDVVMLTHASIIKSTGSSESQFDFTAVDLDQKNRINLLGADTFAVMKETDEPFFGRIQSFLESPRNGNVTTKYYEIVDEIRRLIAAQQAEVDRFEDILNQLYEVVCDRYREQLTGKRRTLRVLISFMYFNCDIGRKA